MGPKFKTGGSMAPELVVRWSGTVPHNELGQLQPKIIDSNYLQK